VHAGVAVALDPDDVSPTTLAAALRQLVTEPRYAERARGLAMAASRYDAPRSTADAMDRLLR
jgi:UDP:flavonoid glycosyltransferase YjiC (YdhE family)